MLALSLAVRTGRKQRAAPLLLVSGCLATLALSPWTTICMDLHLITRIYLAGGPGYVNDWAQKLMNESKGKQDGPTSVEWEQVPPGIRTNLAGHVSVGGTIWSDQVRVRVELGGGFYHYGVVVFPTDQATPPVWWQYLLGWPPEVKVYHE